MDDRRIAENLEEVRGRIAAACDRAGRDPASVTLVAVTKQRPLEDLRALLALGVAHFAENRIAEAEEKFAALAGTAPFETHFIGRIQTNKAKHIARLFRFVHSVDRADAAQALSRAAAAQQRTLDIFLQCNVSGEATKAGADGAGARALLAASSSLPNLRVAGLMTMAPLEAEPEATRPVFRALRRLRDSLQEEAGAALPDLSMGMTNDFEVAIEEGATHLRIGSALFRP